MINGLPDPHTRSVVAKIAAMTIQNLMTRPQQPLPQQIGAMLISDLQNLGGAIMTDIMNSLYSAHRCQPGGLYSIDDRDPAVLRLIWDVVGGHINTIIARTMQQVQQGHGQMPFHQTIAPQGSSFSLGYDVPPVQAQAPQAVVHAPIPEEPVATFSVEINAPKSGSSSDTIVEKGEAAFDDITVALDREWQNEALGYFTVNSVGNISEDVIYRHSDIMMTRPFNDSIEMLDVLTDKASADILAPGINWISTVSYETINMLDIPYADMAEPYRMFNLVVSRTNNSNADSFMKAFSNVSRKVYDKVSSILVREINRRLAVVFHHENYLNSTNGKPVIQIDFLDDIKSLESLPGLEKLCSMSLYHTALRRVIYSAFNAFYNNSVTRGLVAGHTNMYPRGRLLRPTEPLEMNDILHTRDFYVSGPTIDIKIKDDTDLLPMKVIKVKDPETEEEVDKLVPEDVPDAHRIALTNRDYGLIGHNEELRKKFISQVSRKSFLTQARTVIISNFIHNGIWKEIDQKGYYFAKNLSTPLERMIYDHLVKTSGTDPLVEVIIFSKTKANHVISHTITAGIALDGRLVLRK